MDNYFKLPMMTTMTPTGRSWEDAAMMAHTNSTIASCHKIAGGVRTPCEKPYRRVPTIVPEGEPNMCYTIESQWGKPNSKDDNYLNTFEIALTFQNQPHEYVVSTELVALQIAIHDRKKLVNPYLDGFSLRGGGIYEARISMKEKHLLPHPYETNCRDYQRLWRENNGTGPLDEFMCAEKCKLDALLKRDLCIDKNVVYPNWNNMCNKGVTTTTNDIVENCVLSCPQPCSDRTYEVRYEEVGNFDRMCVSAWCKISRTKVVIHFRKFEVTKITHEPKYQCADMFSYIGGYMVLWIGVNIVALFDLLEMICCLLCYPLGRRKVNPEWNNAKEKSILVRY